MTFVLVFWENKCADYYWQIAQYTLVRYRDLKNDVLDIYYTTLRCIGEVSIGYVRVKVDGFPKKINVYK